MSIASDVLALLRQLDEMYEKAVTEAGSHLDDDFLAWGERALAQHFETARTDRRVPRLVRRGARTAAKLRRWWEERPVPSDWRSAVDEAVGGRGWLPGLELARWALEADPRPELFAEVQERFRWAHLRPWLEGVGYHEYLEARTGEPDPG